MKLPKNLLPSTRFQHLTKLALALVCMPSSADGVTFRWAISSNRIYVTGPGVATLTDIKTALPGASLTVVGPASNRVWYLSANLFVEQGARLNLYGPALGGDVAELRLKSDNTSNGIVELRADWGWLDIRHTRLTSWDSAANGPDTETDTYRRAFVRARSTLDADGVTARESRMDIVNSDMGYLGSHHAEAYGVVWKVVATATNVPAGQTIFDLVNVYGDIVHSRLHHNFFGVYTYGHHGGYWANNEVDHNVQYGFDPHDDSDYLVIENNNVHHNGWHGIIASKRCDHGVMRNNISWNNGLDTTDLHGHGIMLHRASNDWLIENNLCHDNADTGIAIFASERALIRNNVCLDNANAGIRLNVGSADNWIEGNEIGDEHRYGLYLFEGDDAPEPDDDGGPGTVRCRGNTFTNNLVYNCTSDSIKINGADSNTFVANVIRGDELILRFQNGTNNVVAANILPSNALLKLLGAATNLNSVAIKQQPRLTVQLDAHSSATFTDDVGAIFDFDESVAENRVTRRGSSLRLTATEGDDETTVITRNFFVDLNTAETLVRLPLWELGGQRRKQWVSQPTSTSARVRFTVGDLAGNRAYGIYRNGQVLASVLSDAGGWVSIADAPGATNAFHYTLLPTNSPPSKPIVSVVATDTVCRESGTNPGRFSVRRVGSIANELTVRYSLSGSAQNGTDYDALSGWVTIPMLDDDASVVVVPVDDAQLEQPETVLLTLLLDSAYDIQLQSAVLNILDNDPPPLKIACELVPAVEPTNRLLALTWNAVAGYRYQLQYNSDLPATNWLNLGDPLTASDESVTVYDLIAGSPRRLYRVHLLP